MFVNQEVSTSKTGMNSPALTETTFLVHVEEGFTLAPVVATRESEPLWRMMLPVI